MSTPSLRSAVSQMMESAWRDPGFCVPNSDTYPFQWLWDSCFHCLVWNDLGSDRAVIELQSVFAQQHVSGFVPHMTYWGDPDFGSSFWGKSKTSTITQPPMYGHVIAQLEQSGKSLNQEMFKQATNGLLHLLTDRERTRGGLVPIFHPWESGCDDSARWDSWRDSSNVISVDLWRADKTRFVNSLILDEDGAPVANDQFTTGSIGFNALVSWNAQQLLEAAESRVDSFDEELVLRLSLLRKANLELVRAIQQRWDSDLLTWVDDGLESASVRTADALLGLLVDPRPEAFGQLTDPKAFRGDFGLRGVHLSEPTYDPEVYWRGPTWPQLVYLLKVAAQMYSLELAAEVSDRFIAGACRSGLAEYWHPETGEGLGAIPQTWAGLALICE